MKCVCTVTPGASCDCDSKHVYVVKHGLTIKGVFRSRAVAMGFAEGGAFQHVPGTWKWVEVSANKLLFRSPGEAAPFTTPLWTVETWRVT